MYNKPKCLQLIGKTYNMATLEFALIFILPFALRLITLHCCFYRLFRKGNIFKLTYLIIYIFYFKCKKQI